MVNKFTINGQQYDSPEAMPPDVRRTYEEAMRTMGSSLARSRSSGSTQVFTSRAGQGDVGVVVNRVVTVNHRAHGSGDELPPDVRQRFEDALKGAAQQSSAPKTSVHVSVNVERPQVRTLDGSFGPATTPPLPLDPTSTEGKIRELPKTLAFMIVIGLIFWARLGCQ